MAKTFIKMKMFISVDIESYCNVTLLFYKSEVD